MKRVLGFLLAYFDFSNGCEEKQVLVDDIVSNQSFPWQLDIDMLFRFLSRLVFVKYYFLKYFS